MAIPLIQNVEKQDINTSIIAIRRQLEQLYNALGVTESTVSSGDISTGADSTPLGTIAGYEGTTDPADGQWLICDGRDTTGTSIELSTHYPSLYTFLGGTNVLPEIFDHSKPSALETIVNGINIPVITAQYDGLFIVTTRTTETRYFIINGVNTNIPVNNSGKDTETSFLLKKGDTFTINGSSTMSLLTISVNYYKQHKIIKAVAPTDQYTPPSSEIQQIEQYFDNGINTIKNGFSISETETPTGRKVFGKPTYTKGFVFTSSTSQATNFALPYADNIVESHLCIKGNNYVSCSPYIFITSGTNTWGQAGATFRCNWSDHTGWNSSNGYVWFEYTKSTDS